MDDLPPSSPPTSRETTPEQFSRNHRVKRLNHSPARPTSVPLDEDLFEPGNDYDHETLVDDREPSPVVANGTTAIEKSASETTTTLPTDFRIPSNNIVAGWAALRDTCLAIEKWIQPLGPVSGWAQKFREGYDQACLTEGNTQEGVDQFFGEVQKHIDIGQGILYRLRGFPIIRPQASTDAWGDWLIAGDMLGTLYQGISVLEAHLDILAPRCPISSDSTSKVRQWVGLDAFL
jgi:hypothetical protein